MTSRGSWSERVAQNFNAAATGYDSNAGIQRRIAESFDRWIPNHVGNSAVNHSLEIGCGTGFLSRRILERWPDSRWLLTDIAPKMIGRCEQALVGPRFKVNFVVADAQSMDLPANSLDLIVSNMTFQWFNDLVISSRRLLEFLRPGGRLIFSTLGQGTFRTARELIDGAFYDYPSESQLKRDLQSTDTTCHVESHLFSESTKNLGSLLRHLNSIGAGTPVPGGPVPPSQLRRAMRKSVAENKAFDVEYEVLFVAMQKC